jgi:hypothetical protein
VLVTKGRLQTEEPEITDDEGEGRDFDDLHDGVEVDAPPAQDLATDAGGESLAPDLISGRESEAAAINDPAEDAADHPAGAVTGKSRLTSRGKRLVDAIRGQYAGVPVGAEFTVPANPVGVKSSG